MEEKINRPSQIKTAESETKFSEDIYSGMYSYVYKFAKDLVLAILRAEDINTKVSAQGKNFKNMVEREKLDERVNIITPHYIKRLEELGFPDKEIDFETHKKEITKLLKNVK